MHYFQSDCRSIYSILTGIAVVSLGLVDGKGHQVPLLQCPPPSIHGYEDIDCVTDLQDSISTQVFDLRPDSKKPGIAHMTCADP